MRTILLLPLVARCLGTMDVCTYMAHVVFMSAIVTVYGSVEMFVEYRPLKIVFFYSWSVEVCCMYV